MTNGGTILVCPNCAKEEPEGSHFCGSCGTPFEPPAEPAALTAAVMSNAPMLTCASCGNEEPQGSRFCGSCGTPFEAAEQPLADAETSQPIAAPPSPDESAPPASPAGKWRLRWLTAGAAAVLLLAAGATAVAFLLSGDDTPNSTPTEHQLLPSTASETEPVVTSPTLADRIGPSLQDVAAAQTAVNVGVRALVASAGSLTGLRQAGDSLAASVMRAQGFLDTLTPRDSTEATTLSLLRLALSLHLAYADTIAGFPADRQSFTAAQAQTAIAGAEQAQRAYMDVANADPVLPIVSINSSDHGGLLAVVPEPTPVPTVARRVIDLAPLLVGIRPDDPPGEGRCFGPYTSRATLSVAGVVYRSGFIQCGDDANGDPRRASGIYRFSGPALPAGSRLARFTAQLAIDESSSSSQRRTQVTWTVVYDGASVCTATVVWSGSRPSPTKLDCRLRAPASVGGVDLRRLRIQQVAVPASSGSLWAGLLNPRVVVEVPGR